MKRKRLRWSRLSCFGAISSKNWVFCTIEQGGIRIFTYQTKYKSYWIEEAVRLHNISHNDSSHPKLCFFSKAVFMWLVSPYDLARSRGPISNNVPNIKVPYAQNNSLNKKNFTKNKLFVVCFELFILITKRVASLRV